MNRPHVRVSEFLRQAKVARERAAAADTKHPEEWLKLAEAWEEAAAEFAPDPDHSD